MATVITNESKNNLSVTNEEKPTGGAFGDFEGRAFGDSGTFGQPGTYIKKEVKNNLNISNETKN